MAKHGRWYRSLSTPSQLLLLACLALCVVFSFGIARQLQKYLHARAELQQAEADLAGLRQKGERLREIEQNIEIAKEGMAREGSSLVRPNETLVVVLPGPLAEEDAKQIAKRPEIPSWRQWWALFFGPASGEEALERLSP